MSDKKPKVAPTEPKPKGTEPLGELSDDALDGVSGGMALGLAIPRVTGASPLPSMETDTCISQ